VSALESFFLDALAAKREARFVMRRFAIALTPVLFVLTVACAEDPDEPSAFQTQGNTTANNDDDSDTGPLQDMAADTGDGDGDGDPTTTGDGDGDPTTTGDGDGDPTTTGDGDGDAMCGNGLVDDGEQCDGGNLNGFSCTDLGYSGGTLACDPITCTYDASGCVNNTDNGGGGTTG
jgi:hypothetical protein